MHHGGGSNRSRAGSRWLTAFRPILTILDTPATVLRNRLTVQWQIRVGVVMSYLAMGFICWLPFTNEPLAIYMMGSLALLWAGIGVIISAVDGEDAE